MGALEILFIIIIIIKLLPTPFKCNTKLESEETQHGYTSETEPWCIINPFTAMTSFETDQ